MDKPQAERNFFEELMVVLVIFKMEINESPAFHSLTLALQEARQKSSIFIYDNSPNAHAHTRNENWKITYRNDPANPGVSKAYNEGFRVAKSNNKKWLLLADQDTVFPNDFFLKCKISIEKHENERIFVPVMTDIKGILSPFHFQFGRGFRSKKINRDQYRLAEKRFINSGMLMTCRLFEISGGFDERFKLDFSDLFFSERLSLITQTFFVMDSTCTHSLSASKRSSVQETLGRFKLYCQAADQFGKQTGNFWVILWKYARAVVFFCRYYDWRFITFAFSA